MVHKRKRGTSPRFLIAIGRQGSYLSLLSAVCGHEELRIVCRYSFSSTDAGCPRVVLFMLLMPCRSLSTPLKENLCLGTRMSPRGVISDSAAVCIQLKFSFGGVEGNRTPFHNTFPIKVSGISTHTTINFTDSLLNQ